MQINSRIQLNESYSEWDLLRLLTASHQVLTDFFLMDENKRLTFAVENVKSRSQIIKMFGTLQHLVMQMNGTRISCSHHFLAPGILSDVLNLVNN